MILDSFFHKKNVISTINQDFIWLAEYANGSYLSEFDLKTHKSNNFYAIDKSQIIKFGLIGQNMSFYYDVFGGSFFINGEKIDFIYKVENKIYRLTNQNLMYNDIITFKDAYSDLNPKQREKNKSNIVQYNVGYKVNLSFEDCSFHFKVILEIPYNKAVSMEIRIVGEQDMNGDILVLKNNQIHNALSMPIEKGVGKEINWIVS